MSSILHRKPHEYKLIPASTTGMHLFWINWIVMFMGRFDMIDEHANTMGYLHSDFIRQTLSWSFGDDHAKNVIKQVKFCEKFIDDYTRNGKPLMFQDLLKYYKDNYRNYR